MGVRPTSRPDDEPPGSPPAGGFKLFAEIDGDLINISSIEQIIYECEDVDGVRVATSMAICMKDGTRDRDITGPMAEHARRFFRRFAIPVGTPSSEVIAAYVRAIDLMESDHADDDVGGVEYRPGYPRFRRPATPTDPGAGPGGADS